MDRDNRPKGREKNVTGAGKGVSRRESGGSYGPVGSGSNPFGRKDEKPAGSSRPTTGGSRPSGGTGRPGGSIPPTQGSGGKRSSSGGKRGGGMSPLMLILLLIVFFFGRGFLGGGGSSDNGTSQSYTQTPSQNTTQTGSTQSSTTNTGSTQSSTASSNTTSSSTSQTSQPSSVFTGSYASSLQTMGVLNRNVSPSARERYTSLKGGGKDTVTLMVYLCGTDLESRSGMATSDLSEMTKAKLSNKVNLIVYTGGCTRWQNRVVSSSVNQIYQIRDGGLSCVRQDAGKGAMTDPATLTDFITWTAKNYPADRYGLIFWDHGGGSLTG
ncbi:MAG: hypothetical protein IIZ39_02560 [Blautia sp.]|nr:hypothetical protein [Blautia sp.]